MGARMTRIKRIYADQIRVNPLDPRHPRSHIVAFVYQLLKALHHENCIFIHIQLFLPRL